MYTPCTTPQAGEGLFNQTELDLNNDGIADEVDTACGDLPAIDLEKEIISAVQLPDGSYDVTYTVVVSNAMDTLGTYDLTDTPGFDDDFTINSASSYTS